MKIKKIKDILIINRIIIKDKFKEKKIITMIIINKRKITITVIIRIMIIKIMIIFIKKKGIIHSLSNIAEKILTTIIIIKKIVISRIIKMAIISTEQAKN